MTAKTPFDLDVFISKQKNPPYVFKFAQRDWSMTNAKDIDAWQSLEAADTGDVEAMLEIMRLAFGDEQYVEFKQHPLPAHALGELFQRYQKHSGVEPGE